MQRADNIESGCGSVSETLHPTGPTLGLLLEIEQMLADLRTTSNTTSVDDEVLTHIGRYIAVV